MRHQSIRMAPDTDPIGALPDLVRPIWLPMRYSGQAFAIQLSLLLHDITLVIVLDFFSWGRKKHLIYFRG